MFEEMSDEDRALLTPEFFRASKGRWVIEVGWVPAHDPTGEFKCDLLLDGDRSNPIESHRTRDPRSMFRWTEKMMKMAAERS